MLYVRFWRLKTCFFAKSLAGRGFQRFCLKLCKAMTAGGKRLTDDLQEPSR